MKTGIATTVGLVAVVLLTIIGCCSYQEQYVRSYIQQYIMYDDICVRRSNDNSKHLDLYSKTSKRVDFRSEGNDKIEYENICKANGDTCYNRYIYTPSGLPIIMTEYPHFSKINVYSNKDFDEEHPAGTPLNDVIDIIYHSALEYIRSGYTAESSLYEKKVKRLSELRDEDLNMNTENIFLAFTKDPDIIDIHTITFECINAHGETYTTTYNYDFSLAEGEVEPEVTVTYETL